MRPLRLAMIVALGALLIPGPVRSQSGPDCAVAGAPGPIRSGPSSATPPSNGRASVRCSYGGSGRSAAVSIDYRCEGARSSYQRQARRDHDERGPSWVADRREGSFRSYGTRYANQDRVFALLDDRTYATVIAHSNGGQDLGALRALARRVAARNDPGSALGCGGSAPVEPESSPPEPNRDPAPTETAVPSVREEEPTTERAEPAPAVEPAPGPTCDRFPDDDGGLLALLDGQLGHDLGRVGVSGGVEWNIPGAPCFSEHIELAFAANAHGLDTDRCTTGASASGSLSVCTEAFCFKDCITGTVSGGWSVEAERRCDEPPFWSCDPDTWCERKSASLSLERSQSIAPRVAIGLSKMRLECGLEIGLSLGLSGNVTRFAGPGCECGGGSWAGTVRAFTTLSGTARCGVQIFGRRLGVPPFGVEGCLNAGVRRDAGRCRDAGTRVVGGAAFKAQVPPITVGWFKVNGTLQTVQVPEGVETGCSGPTDL